MPTPPSAWQYRHIFPLDWIALQDVSENFLNAEVIKMLKSFGAFFSGPGRRTDMWQQVEPILSSLEGFKQFFFMSVLLLHKHASQIAS